MNSALPPKRNTSHTRLDVGASTAQEASFAENAPNSDDLHQHSNFDHTEFVDVPPTEVLVSAGDLLRALSAPVRIAIVLQLLHQERCVHELVEALASPQPLVSQHLRILKEAGVVIGTRNGREVMYRLVDQHLAHIITDALIHVQEPASR